ncbi:MAG: pyridoxal-phosphate dependent enzyme [Pirellula sp.]
MTPTNAITIEEVYAAENVIRDHLSPSPLIRSYALENLLGMKPGRRVWIKDYGWTPVGSFKVMGALNWMFQNQMQLENRPVAAHSSGNFASGIAFAGKRFGVRVIVVMPESAPKIKFHLTKSFGAEIRTYDIATDHLTGTRDRMAREIVESERAIQASPYDDPHVIAGNGVGGLEICHALRRENRNVSHFLCQVSGGGLMAGHAIAIADGFPGARVIGVEPSLADDFRQSLMAQERVRISKPQSICDGLLSYDVGQHNWPILKRLVNDSVVVSDSEIVQAMKWMYENHGLRTEPSGAITIAACMFNKTDLTGEGDVVLILSGRNIDESTFRGYLAV